jgi:protein-S-isoprenylcysteine O-methyltransferase Ste14
VKVAIGNFLFRFRNALFPLAGLLVLLPGRRIFPDPLHALLAGVGIALLGQGIRIATIGYEYIIRGGRNRRVYAEKLVTDGFYHLCRNPLYVGNLLILAGLAVTSNSLGCLLLAVPLFTGVYIAIVAAEEHFLRDKFGVAYEHYVSDVPRWLPRLGALREAIGNGRFHWKRVLMKEYGTPFGWITLVFLIGLWHLHEGEQFTFDQGPLAGIVIAYGLLAVLYLFVRNLKHSRRMVAD